MLISLTDNSLIRKFQLKSMRVFWQGQSSFMHIVNEVTQMEQAQRDRSRMEFQQMIMRNVSHEYRTPLNAIIASTQIVVSKLDQLMTSVSDRVVRKLTEIKNQVQIEYASSKLMLTLVNGMIYMATIQSERLTFMQEMFSLSEIKREIVNLF